jgi:hypothetical protein
MNQPIEFTPRERQMLWVIALIGLLGPNGVFLYCAFFHWETIPAALRNPVAAAFIFEAFAVMGLLAWAIRRFRLGVLSWVAFVLLSLVGGLAFSIPAFLLWRSRGGAVSKPE